MNHEFALVVSRFNAFWVLKHGLNDWLNIGDIHESLLKLFGTNL